MTEFRLQDPWWLLALLPLAAAVAASAARRNRAALWYSSAALLKTLPVTWAQRLARGLPSLRSAGLLLIVVALARPQHGLSEFRARTEGIAIMMCIDRSGSMQALDFQQDGRRVDRLAAVKKVFRDFVAGSDRLAGRPDDWIGLIAFGGFAEARAPLTLDHAALLEVLDSVEIARPIHDDEGRVINEPYLAEEQATALGDAMTLAVDRLKDAAPKSKVIILLSDGENTAGVVPPEAAARAAREFGIKIYAIGIGSTGRAPFPAQDVFGRQVLISRTVRLDEETLTMMAHTSQGRYFNARDTRALEEVYAEIDRLEKTVTEGRVYTQYRELYPWLVLPGLALILLEFVLRCTRLRSLP